MKATYAHNPVGQTVAVTYTKGTATWYSDQVSLSISGQAVSQTSTLGHDTYSYDNLGRTTEVSETPTGKGCTSTRYGYDEESDRTSELVRTSPTSTCATEGGALTVHTYDEAGRLTDAGATYEPFGAATMVPAADAGGSALESGYYANGTLGTETQGTQTNAYTLDPAGRHLVTLSQTAPGKQTTTISHYVGSDSTPAWTEEEGTTSFTRNIAGIGGSIAAIQTAQEVTLQIVNLHGDVIGIVPDVETGVPKLTSEPTAFGAPTTSSPEPHAWLGSTGLTTEFASGVANDGGGAYVPQLGLFLTPEALSGAAAQDPVNEYLANEGEAEPTEAVTFAEPTAIQPGPVNERAAKEFYEQHPYDPSPINQLLNEEESGVASGKLPSGTDPYIGGGIYVAFILHPWGLDIQVHFNKKDSKYIAGIGPVAATAWAFATFSDLGVSSWWAPIVASAFAFAGIYSTEKVEHNNCIGVNIDDGIPLVGFYRSKTECG